jgi:O-methyltransferase involved in polyketide biosynthesis
MNRDSRKNCCFISHGVGAEAVSAANLKDVNETLFYPLIARHLETSEEDGILSDPKSTEIIKRLDYDITTAKIPLLDRLGICLRTVIIDDITKKFMEANPGGIIVNLGCGLDTRFCRLDNGRVLWFDLDLPDTISLRRQFIAETERNRFIAKSALDFSWTDDIPQGSTTLFIAEGLSYYFTEDENKSLLSAIQEHFSGAEYVFETLNPFFLKLYKKKESDEHLSNKVATLIKWGVKSGRELESWFDGVHFVEEWSVVNTGKNKFPLHFRLLFYLLPILTRHTKIIHLRFT